MKWSFDFYPVASISVNYVASVVFTGFFVVLIALLLLIWLISIIGKIVNFQKDKNTEPVEEIKTQTTKAAEEETLNEEIYIAIISAVCSLSFFESEISQNKAHKITVTLPDNPHPIWTTSGLLEATKPFYFNPKGDSAHV